MNKKHVCLTALLSLCIMPAWATPADQATHDEGRPHCDAALALVKRFHMGAVLEQSANSVARATVTYGLLVKRYGATEGSRRVMQHIAKALPKYQIQWNQNLASVYCKHFSRDELRSLTMLGKASPYASKFRSLHDQVLTEMQDRARQILGDLVGEALVSALKQ